MTLLDRHRVVWTGFIGAPGVSTFYVATGTALNAALATFFTAIDATLPADVVLEIEPAGDTIESSTGALTGAWTDSAPALIHGSDAAAYSAVSGALVRWGCATFLSGRRLRGHTFLVPFGGDLYDTSGQISASVIAIITAAAGSFVTSLSGNLIIWQRPRLAEPAYTDRAGHTHPAVTARLGGYGPVLTGTCRPVVTELRSRRD